MTLTRTRSIAAVAAALLTLVLAFAALSPSAHAQPNTGTGPTADQLKKQACTALGGLKSYWANESNRRQAAGDSRGAQAAWANYVAARSAYETLGCGGAARTATFTPQACRSLLSAANAAGAPTAHAAAARRAHRDGGCKPQLGRAQSAQVAQA